MTQERIRFSGPLFDLGPTELTRRIISRTIFHLYQLAAPLSKRAITAHSPRITGTLARSLIIRYDARNDNILWNYRYPARGYWHFARDGRWPREFDEHAFDAVRQALPEAFNRALRDVLE